MENCVHVGALECHLAVITSILKSGMWLVLILLWILPVSADAHTHVKPQMLPLNVELRHRHKPTSELSAISAYNKSWDRCQRGLRGNALICKACADLQARFRHIWSLKKTHFPRLRLHAANFCRHPGGWMMAMPVPLSLHKHVLSTLLDDIFQTQIPLRDWNAEEDDCMLPQIRGRQQAANGTAAGSSGPDKVHSGKYNWENYQGIAARFVYIKCLYLQMRTHDSALKILYWKHWKEEKCEIPTWAFMKLWGISGEIRHSICFLFSNFW